jgi:hypothetical protein
VWSETKAELDRDKAFLRHTAIKRRSLSEARVLYEHIGSTLVNLGTEIL